MPSSPDRPNRGIEAAGETQRAFYDQVFTGIPSNARKEWKHLRYGAYRDVMGHLRRILRANNQPEQLFEWEDDLNGRVNRVVVCACTEYRLGYTHHSVLTAGGDVLLPEMTTSRFSVTTLGKAVGHTATRMDVHLDATSKNGLVWPPMPVGASAIRLDATDFWYARNPKDVNTPHLPEPVQVASLTDIHTQTGLLLEAAFVLEQCTALTRDDTRVYNPH